MLDATISIPAGVAPVAGNPLGFPFAYWDFQDAAREGATTMLELQEVSPSYFSDAPARPAIPWYEASSVGAGWSNRDGWFDFAGAANNSGANTWFRLPMADADAYRDVLELGNNCLLVCGRISPDNVTGNKSIITVGRHNSSNAYWRIYLTGNALTIRLSNGSGSFVTFVESTITATDYTFAAVLDNREGIHLMFMHHTDSSGRVQFKGPRINTQGAIPWDAGNAVQAINIGGLLQFSGSDIDYFAGEMQRLFVVNYGQNPPNNLNAVVQRAIESGCRPGAYLRG